MGVGQELFERLRDAPVPLVVPVFVFALRSLEFDTVFEAPVPLVVPLIALAP